MDIKEKFGERADGFDNLRTEGKIRDEVTIHDVEVQPIGTSTFSAISFLSEARLVGGKERRRNHHFGNVCVHICLLAYSQNVQLPLSVVGSGVVASAPIAFRIIPVPPLS